MSIQYHSNESLIAAEFADLFHLVWKQPHLELGLLRPALDRTRNITARKDGKLVGCIRLVSDGYLFTAITEVLIHPDVRQQSEITEQLMQLAIDASSTSLLIAVQSVGENLVEKLALERGRGPIVLVKRKPLRVSEDST